MCIRDRLGIALDVARRVDQTVIAVSRRAAPYFLDYSCIDFVADYARSRVREHRLVRFLSGLGLYRIVVRISKMYGFRVLGQVGIRPYIVILSVLVLEMCIRDRAQHLA